MTTGPAQNALAVQGTGFLGPDTTFSSEEWPSPTPLHKATSLEEITMFGTPAASPLLAGSGLHHGSLT